MLPIQNRLRHKSDFEIVKKEGQILHSKFFSFVSHNRGGGDPSRFGFIVSTKISKSAVVRNRVRRLLREAIQSVLPKVKPGYDSVILVRPAIIGRRLGELSQDIKIVLRKSGIIS